MRALVVVELGADDGGEDEEEEGKKDVQTAHGWGLGGWWPGLRGGGGDGTGRGVLKRAPAV